MATVLSSPLLLSLKVGRYASHERVRLLPFGLDCSLAPPSGFVGCAVRTNRTQDPARERQSSLSTYCIE